MSKTTLNLKQAIHSLNIKKPYDLRAQNSPNLRAPVQIKDAQSGPAQNQDSQNELRQTEVTQSQHPKVEFTQKRDAQGGFFMLAHSIFDHEIMRKLSGDAFRIFIWMSAQAWRFKDSNGEFRGAVDYISAGCGCSRSTVSRGLQDLKERKLIECVEQNYKKGNLWRISRIADGRNAELASPQIEVAQNKHPQTEIEGCSKSGSSIVNLTTEHGQIDHETISSNNFKETQLSRSEVRSELIENYLLGTTAGKKRESEGSSFKNLKETFQISDIEIAFQYLADQKYNFKGNNIHSPLSFLTYAMREVLHSAKLERKKIEDNNIQMEDVQGAAKKAQNDLKNIKEETSCMVQKFKAEFIGVDEMELKISELVGGLPFKGKEQRMAYAAQKWWLECDEN